MTEASCQEADLEHRKALWAAISGDPDGYESNRDFGLYCAARRNFQHLAEPHLLKALALNRMDEDIVRLLFSLSYVNSMKGNFKTARDYCRRLLDLKPENSLSMFHLGDVEFHLGDIEAASDLYARANERLKERAFEIAGSTGEPVTRILTSGTATHRYLGEMARMVDLFVKARELGIAPDFKELLLAPEDEVANMCLLDYWRDHVTIVSDRDDVEDCLARFGGGDFRMDFMTFPDDVVTGGMTFDKDLSYGVVCKRWEEEGREPLLKLKPDHLDRGRETLKRLGLPGDAWFAVLHIREPGYYRETSEWSYNRFRDSDIENYIPAIKTITGRGGWVMRMGDPTATPLPKMERVIDYAHSEECIDWMDIFCLGGARFFLGTPSGPQGTAAVFGVPVITSDWFPLGNWPRSGNDIFIHRLLVSHDDGRVLSIAEALAPPMFNAISPAHIDAHGLDVVANTPDEIMEAVEEMLDRLDGTMTYSQDDNAVQDRYRKQADPYGIGIPARIGKRFLERHPELIGG